MEPTTQKKPPHRTHLDHDLLSLLGRLRLEKEDVYSDPRLEKALRDKVRLDRAICDLRGAQFSPRRIAEVSRRYAFHTSDVAGDRRIAFLIKGLIEGERTLESLKAVKQ